MRIIEKVFPCDNVEAMTKLERAQLEASTSQDIVALALVMDEGIDNPTFRAYQAESLKYRQEFIEAQEEFVKTVVTEEMMKEIGGKLVNFNIQFRKRLLTLRGVVQ